MFWAFPMLYMMASAQRKQEKNQELFRNVALRKTWSLWACLLLRVPITNRVLSFLSLCICNIFGFHFLNWIIVWLKEIIGKIFTEKRNSWSEPCSFPCNFTPLKNLLFFFCYFHFRLSYCILSRMSSLSRREYIPVVSHLWILMYTVYHVWFQLWKLWVVLKFISEMLGLK